jgi:hypothetical protein
LKLAFISNFGIADARAILEVEVVVPSTSFTCIDVNFNARTFASFSVQE